MQHYIRVFYVYKVVIGRAGGIRDSQMKGKQACGAAAETGEENAIRFFIHAMRKGS